MISRPYSPGRMLRFLAPALAIVAVLACGHMRPGPAPEPAWVIFVNESLDQADVFAVVAGSDTRRLGTVMPGRTDTLTVPTDVTARSGSISIVARILAHSYAPSTGPVTIYPGETYVVRLPSDGRMLSFLPASE